jgi:hypothetical protein
MRRISERAVQAAARALRAAGLAIVLAAPLAACGDAEPDQRRAFIAFLKTRIVDKPGVHLPIPSDDERKSFGPYEAQFEVISGFNKALDQKSDETMGAFARLSAHAHSLGDLMTQKADLQSLHDGIDAFEASLKAQVDAANSARAAFPPQPDDLKPVYAAAFDRDVTAPGAVMGEALPVANASIASMLDIVAFIQAHPGIIVINGPSVTTSDPKLAPQLNALIEKMNENAKRTQAEFQKAQSLVTGG